MGRYITESKVPVKTDGLLREVTTSDEDTSQLLESIYVQSKIMNLYLSLITEIEIKENDL